MSPHYGRNAGISCSSMIQSEPEGGWDEQALDDAAVALRQTELEAVHADVAAPESPRLENMSIDELRALAASLAIPNRGSITEQDQLIAAIRQRL